MEAKDNKNVELARKALMMGVKAESFGCNVGCYEGGKCGNDFATYEEIEISKDQLMYLLNQSIGHDEVFEGIAMLPFDLDEELDSLAYEASWPNGGARVVVRDAIPEELKELADRLDEFDEDDMEELNDVREQLNDVSGGSYTFMGDVVDGSFDYYFAEDAEFSVNLEASEALGLLYGYSGNLKAFRGICRNKLDEDYVSEKINASGEADNYDCYSYSGTCDEYERYAEAWGTLIGKILNGDISEEDLPGWVEFFDDKNHIRDCEDIETWHD